MDAAPDDDLPDIHADPDKFTQVVTNLVENAVRHGEGTVHVAVAPLGPGELGDQAGVRITVDDEGEGIPVEMRRRVFTTLPSPGCYPPVAPLQTAASTPQA